MAKRSFPLSKVYGLFEPGPVLLLSTAHKGLIRWLVDVDPLAI